MELNALTTTLSNFVAAFSGAYDRLIPVRNGLLGALLGIEILLVGFWIALDGGQRMAAIIRKILFLGFCVPIRGWAERLSRTAPDVFRRARG